MSKNGKQNVQRWTEQLLLSDLRLFNTRALSRRSRVVSRRKEDRSGGSPRRRRILRQGVVVALLQQRQEKLQRETTTTTLLSSSNGVTTREWRARVIGDKREGRESRE